MSTKNIKMLAVFILIIGTIFVGIPTVGHYFLDAKFKKQLTEFNNTFGTDYNINTLPNDTAHYEKIRAIVITHLIKSRDAFTDVQAKSDQLRKEAATMHRDTVEQVLAYSQAVKNLDSMSLEIKKLLSKFNYECSVAARTGFDVEARAVGWNPDCDYGLF